MPPHHVRVDLTFWTTDPVFWGEHRLASDHSGTAQEVIWVVLLAGIDKICSKAGYFQHLHAFSSDGSSIQIFYLFSINATVS